MIGGQDAEIANRIGNILLDIIPDGAERITAKSEVGEDWAESDIEFLDEAGTSGHFSFENAPRRAVGDINRALVDLRQAMSKGGGDPWNRSVFTARRDGKFDVSFSYEDSPDS